MSKKMGEAQRRNLQLELYRDLVKVYRSFQVETVAEEILRSLQTHFNADLGALVLMDHSSDEILNAFYVGPHSEESRDSEPVWFGYQKRAMAGFLQDMIPRSFSSKDMEPFKVAGEDVKVHWVIPLDLNYNMAALLFLGSTDSEKLSHSEFEVVEPIFTEMAFALKNANYVQRIQDLTTKDDLTLAFNRRFFESFLDEEVARARRFGNPLSVIFLDLDGLRRVNDLYGHAMGSKTLQEVAGRLLLTVRNIDKVFRYGGDEFVIILPETEADGAYGVAERIRNVLNQSLFLVEETGGLKITGSFGIAQFPIHATDKNDLVKRADAAMYQIKTQQKDDILIAETLPPEEDS